MIYTCHGRLTLPVPSLFYRHLEPRGGANLPRFYSFVYNFFCNYFFQKSPYIELVYGCWEYFKPLTMNFGYMGLPWEFWTRTKVLSNFLLKKCLWLLLSYMISESRFFKDYSKSIYLTTLTEGSMERSRDFGHFEPINGCVRLFLKEIGNMHK